MKKRISGSIALLTMLSLFLVSAFLSLLYYNQVSTAIRTELREQGEVFKAQNSAAVIDALSLLKRPDMHFSVIKPDGSVLYDSLTQAETLPNQADKLEITQALANGSGFSQRPADSILRQDHYYALKLNDGSILRLAKDTLSLAGIGLRALPILITLLIFLLVLGNMEAHSVTRAIVTPINQIQLGKETIPPFDELAPFARNTNEQRAQYQKQLAAMQDRAETISTLTDSMSEGIVMVNNQGVILSLNKSAEAFFEVKTQVVGRNILELFRDVDLIEHVRNAIDGQRGELNIELENKVFRAYFSPVADNGAIILFLDITERVKSETMRREFSANVSHELKTPLTTIYGNAEILADGMVQEADKQRFYEKIKDEAGRLIALIEDIIHISRLDESDVDETTEDVDLYAVAEETVDSLAQKAEEFNVALTLEGARVHLHANRSQMYELFYNLIDNAVTYNKPGGTVAVNLTETNDRIQIMVKDSGIGIPKEAQERVFERFYRVDKSRSKKTGGTGLGLAIVKHIVLGLNGKIDLVSNENSGTTITIHLKKTK